MLYKRFFIVLFSFTLIAGIYSFVSVADDPLDKISQQLEKWTDEQSFEKVYLHFDKPYYAAGDIIWFKAYVVNGSSHQSSNLSGIVNVELIDERDSVKQSIKLALDSGKAHGDFALPDTTHQGNYRIRAYTNYMRNAGSEYFFDQPITIINAIFPGKDSTSLAAQINKRRGKIDVQFFPESGFLVNDVSSNVAFKALSPSGLGAIIKGNIVDDQGRQVASLSSNNLGMGKFEMTPKAGAAYQARITSADGSENIYPLPKAIDKGYVLTITNDDPENLQIKIATSKSLFADDPKRFVTLVAQSAGKIYYTVNTNPGSEVFTSVVPRNKFPTGIVQFILFSPAGEPLNERLVFIQNQDHLNLNLIADKPAYQLREKVKITLDAQNSANKPAIGNFSVSVIDETKVPADEDSPNNILANLLLTSDLKGYIERPGYYFNKINDQTRADLDVLMLTQGYRRFEWKQIMQNVFPEKQYKPENSLQVSGTVVTPGGTPVLNAKVKLYDLDSIEFTRDTVTDERGRFTFDNLAFNDSVRLIIQAVTSKNKKNVDIKMDKPVPVSISGNKNIADYNIDVRNHLTVYAKSSRQLYDVERRFGLGNHVLTLQEVVISEKKDLLKYSANLNGAGNADQIVQGSMLRNMACPNISDCLQGRLTGVIFRNGMPYSTRGGLRPMQLIVDGMYVDAQYLNVINYVDIRAIEVLRSAGLTSLYGSRGGNGVMLITTRRGGDNDDYPEPIYGRGITTYYPKGYYKAREFYSPRYDRPQTNKQLADLRTTIFWNPDLSTGPDGKISFEYFNAGSKGTYRVEVEGIDGEGNIGRKIYRYKVQ